MLNLFNMITTFATAIMVILILSFLMAWPVMALWNGCLVDAVHGVQPVTWLQAWGISILFGWLFRSTPSANKS